MSPPPDAALPSGLPNEHRHLTLGEDASREVIVSWSTPAAVRNPRVERSGSQGVVTVPAVTRAPLSGPRRFHHARLDGLLPGHTYRYRPVHDGPDPSEGNGAAPAAAAGGAAAGAAGPDGGVAAPDAGWVSFRTGPRGPAAFRFTAAADQGTTNAAADLVEVVSQHDPAFHLHPGDLAYANTSGCEEGPLEEHLWERWLALVEPTASGIPWLPAIGNHDVDPGEGGRGHTSFRARFALPGNGPPGVPAYVMRYGHLAVVALDGNDVTFEFPGYHGYSGGAQTAWLAAQLAGLRTDPEVQFVLVMLHYGAYGTHDVHGSDGGVRTLWTPLFDRYDVDVVLSGHNHGYERTLPLRAGHPTRQRRSACVQRPADGTVYLTVGGGGQGEDHRELGGRTGQASSRVYASLGSHVAEATPWTAVADDGNSLAVIDVEPAGEEGPARLHIVAKRFDGRVIDKVVIERPSTARRAAGGSWPGERLAAPMGSGLPVAHGAGG